MSGLPSSLHSICNTAQRWPWLHSNRARYFPTENHHPMKTIGNIFLFGWYLTVSIFEAVFIPDAHRNHVSLSPEDES